MAQGGLKGLSRGGGCLGPQMMFAQVCIIDGPIVRERVAFRRAGAARDGVFFEESAPAIQRA